MSEITSRYETIGVRLADREKGLRNMQEEIKLFLENFKQIQTLLQKQEKLFPSNIATTEIAESEKQIVVIKNILEVMYNNQSVLDETKVNKS